MSCDLARRHSSDPMLLWLWCGPAAVSLIGSLAWVTPYAVGCGPEKDEGTKKKKKKEGISILSPISWEWWVGEKVQVIKVYFCFRCIFS